MKRLRSFLSDLALLPAIWRTLVRRAREEQAWMAKMATYGASPEVQTRRAAVAARVAKREAEAQGAAYLSEVG